MASRALARVAAEPAAHLTETEFCRRIGNAEPGEPIEYHRGHLSIDRTRGATLLPEDLRRGLSRVADRAWRLAEEGRLILAQRRLDAGGFAYLAIMARRPAPRALHGHQPRGTR